MTFLQRDEIRNVNDRLPRPEDNTLQAALDFNSPPPKTGKIKQCGAFWSDAVVPGHDLNSGSEIHKPLSFSASVIVGV